MELHHQAKLSNLYLFTSPNCLYGGLIFNHNVKVRRVAGLI